MRKLARGALLAAACVLLTGCPEVARVEGTVTGSVGGFLASPRQLAPGDQPRPYSRVAVGPGSSVTLREDGCEVTFTRDFVVPSRLGGCDRDDQRQDERDAQERDQPQDEPGESRAEQPREPAQDVQAQAQAPSQVAQARPGGLDAAWTADAAVGTAGGSTAGATGVGTGGAGAAGTSLLQDALLVLGGAAVARKAYDEVTEDTRPVSR